MEPCCRVEDIVQSLALEMAARRVMRFCCVSPDSWCWDTCACIVGQDALVAPYDFRSWNCSVRANWTGPALSQQVPPRANCQAWSPPTGRTLSEMIYTAPCCTGEAARPSRRKIPAARCRLELCEGPAMPHARCWSLQRPSTIRQCAATQKSRQCAAQAMGMMHRTESSPGQPI